MISTIISTTSVAASTITSVGGSSTITTSSIMSSGMTTSSASTSTAQSSSTDVMPSPTSTSSTSSCEVVDIQFTIGFLDDDDNNCNGDINTYPPVLLYYRQHKDDNWIVKWNTSDISDPHQRVELSLAISSSPPHLTLRWTQEATSTTPKLFISDINLEGSGGTGNKCKLDQLIDFGEDGLDYVQCTSGTSATYDCSGNNEVGLVFDGTSRELRTCNFNLASGKCFGQDDTCTISHQPSPSTTTISVDTSTTSSFMNSVLLPSQSSTSIMTTSTMMMSTSSVTTSTSTSTGESSLTTISSTKSNMLATSSVPSATFTVMMSTIITPSVATSTAATQSTFLDSSSMIHTLASSNMMTSTIITSTPSITTSSVGELSTIISSPSVTSLMSTTTATSNMMTSTTTTSSVATSTFSVESSTISPLSSVITSFSVSTATPKMISTIISTTSVAASTFTSVGGSSTTTTSSIMSSGMTTSSVKSKVMSSSTTSTAQSSSTDVMPSPTSTSSTSSCEVVDVQFTIGFLDDDDDNNCNGDINTYPPVLLYYRQHKDDDWIVKWNTSDISDPHQRVELSLAISSSPPHLTLRWTQEATSTTPKLFISDINLEGSGGTGNKCKLDQLIDFGNDGLDYVQCTSGTSATYDCSGNNEVGLVFGGTSRELRTCNFNLASGKCFGQDDTCTISHQPSPSATTISADTSTTSSFMNSVLLPSQSSTSIMTTSTMMMSTSSVATSTLSVESSTIFTMSSVITSFSVSTATPKMASTIIPTTSVAASTISPVGGSSTITTSSIMSSGMATFSVTSKIMSSSTTASSSTDVMPSPTSTSSTSSCEVVDVQFTIGFLDDDDNNCNGDINKYPPVLLYYRQHKDDDWIVKWNTSDISDPHQRVELSLAISSSPPHLTLRWTQEATSTTPKLFISDINLEGSGGTGNKCKLDQLIDFGDDGLDYVQCTSGTSATYDCSGNNEVGLVFDGTSRELRTCNFNLASGKCFGQDDTCTISNQPSPSTTTISADTSTTSSFMNSVLLPSQSSTSIMTTSTMMMSTSSVATSSLTSTGESSLTTISSTKSNMLTTSSVPSATFTVLMSTIILTPSVVTSTASTQSTLLDSSSMVHTASSSMMTSTISTSTPSIATSSVGELSTITSSPMTSVMSAITATSNMLTYTTSTSSVVTSTSSSVELSTISAMSNVITSFPVSTATSKMTSTIIQTTSIAIQSTSIDVIPSPTSTSVASSCEVVNVQFTIGFLDDDDNNCNGDINTYPPVLLYYRQHKDDDWIVKWNTSDISDPHQRVELSLPISPSQPHLILKWTQDIAPTTPTLFISDINLEGSGGPGSNCKLDQIIEFDDNGMDYVQCTSGTIATHNCSGDDTISLVFDGAIRELRTCTFNLASGRCIDQEVMCMINIEPSASTLAGESPTTTPSSVLASPSVSSGVLMSISATVKKAASTSVFTSSFLSTSTVMYSNKITPTIIPEYCQEEVTNYTIRVSQPLNTTRVLYCRTDKVFITQICEKSAEGEPNWYPELTSCNEDGLPISEDLFTTITTIPFNDNDTQLETVKSYTEKPDIEILDGDPVVILDILQNSSRENCTKEYIENYIISVDNLMDYRFLNRIKLLGKQAQEAFISTLFSSTDYFVLYCYKPKYPPPPTSYTGISAVDIEDPNNIERLNLSTSVYGSFRPPNSLIATALDERIKKFRVGSYSFDNLDELLMKPIYRDNTVDYFNAVQFISPVNSKVVNCATQSCKEAMEEGIEIVINHRPTTGNTMCAYYNFSKMEEYEPFWSTDGCIVQRSSPEQTVCTCTHLTHFVVLSDSRQSITQASTSEDQCTQPFILYVCIAISLIVLILIIVILVMYRSLWNFATFVHINLCATLFIAHLLLILICLIADKAGCAAVAILIHYFFLASFMWLLMEVVVLYIILIKVFEKVTWKHYIIITLLSYGGPLLYMILCIPLGLGRSDKWSYGSEDLCWLTYKDGFILAFIIPVLVIVILAFLLLILLLTMQKKFEEKHKIDENCSQTISNCYKRWLQGLVLLTFTVTTTWALALAHYYKLLLLTAYVFGISLVIQAIILFLLLIIYFRKVCKVWYTYIFNNKAIDTLEDYTFENVYAMDEFSEDVQTISYSPVSHKEFMLEKSRSFREKNFSLKETFVDSNETGVEFLVAEPVASSSL
ncbi:serine-rich adhesin for platelets-like [Dysidea avara]|uniref:serine-rich adhesin for platelets-like n=1 Tax=Dysidea avara TaxID=196820 RepID=UPI00332AF24F